METSTRLAKPRMRGKLALPSGSSGVRKLARALKERGKTESGREKGFARIAARRRRLHETVHADNPFVSAHCALGGLKWSGMREQHPAPKLLILSAFSTHPAVIWAELWAQCSPIATAGVFGQSTAFQRRSPRAKAAGSAAEA